MKYIILLIVTISCISNADSCVLTDADEKQYNDLHSNKVTIESTLNSSNYFVTNSIEDQSLNAVWLVSGSIEEPTFTAPLKVFHEGEQLVAWYSINADLIRKDYIVVGFAGDCGPSIVKEVLYQR